MYKFSRFYDINYSIMVSSIEWREKKCRMLDKSDFIAVLPRVFSIRLLIFGFVFISFPFLALPFLFFSCLSNLPCLLVIYPPTWDVWYIFVPFSSLHTQSRVIRTAFWCLHSPNAFAKCDSTVSYTPYQTPLEYQIPKLMLMKMPMPIPT